MDTLQNISIQKYLNIKIKNYNYFVVVLLTVLLTILIFTSISVGSSNIGISDIINSLLSKELLTAEAQIINYVRIPRTLSAILVGCALSVSGLILQSVLNNALASPNIIGVNSGAGLFTALATAFFSANISLMPISAFLGAFLATLLVYTIAKKTGSSRMTIVLAGTAVSSLVGAMTDTILVLFPDTIIDRTSFLIGGLSGVTMNRIILPGIIIVISLIVSFIFSYDLNVLSLGDETSQSLGLNVNRCRFLFIVLASLLAGSAVSFAGLLGFIGLIVPHISRLIVRNNNKLLMPTCALLGSSFALFCDILARTLFAPYEVPVGIIMSFLGSPFFIYLLLKQRRRLVND